MIFVKLVEQLGSPQPREIEKIQEILEGQFILGYSGRKIFANERQQCNFLWSYLIT